MKSTKNTVQDTIVLLEIGGSHDECLYSQLFALKSLNKKMILICTAELKERNPHFDAFVDDYFIVAFTKSKLKNLGVIKQVLRYMKTQRVSRAILNTAQGGNIRNLCLLARFSKIEFIGIIHTTRKFQGSFTQKIINWKIKKYLLLSHFLLSKVTAPKGIQLDYFYPIRFWNQSLIRKQHDKLNITIIGGVENRRKDLDGFLTMIRGVDQSVHFTFLGKSDPQNADVITFKTSIEEAKRTDQITLFYSFVSHEEFNTQLEITDAILPLVHPNTPSADQYFRNQISGAMNVAFGYKIPLLIHDEYSHLAEMKSASLYYSKESFSELISILPEQSSKIIEQMKALKEYDPVYQEERYLYFIFE